MQYFFSLRAISTLFSMLNVLLATIEMEDALEWDFSTFCEFADLASENSQYRVDQMPIQLSWMVEVELSNCSMLV